MTKPLTNRQITNRWVEILKLYPNRSLQDSIEKMLTAQIEVRPDLTPKDRHSIIINTITRYVRYLLTEEDKNA